MRKYVVSGALVSVAVVGLWMWSSRSSAGQTPTSAKLILYSGENFTGRRLEVTDSLPDMPSLVLRDGVTRFSWNDNVRSMVVVSGVFRIFQHGRCNTILDDTPIEELDLSTQPVVRGWSSLVSATSAGPWEIPYLDAVGLDEDISSIEWVSDSNLPDWAVPSH